MENDVSAANVNTLANSTEISAPVIPPKRPILPFVLIALLILAAGGGGYWYWTTTPQYSINRISSSIEQHDLSAFKKYVDIESVTGRAVSQLMESIMKDPNAVHNDFEGFAQGLVETFKPQLVKIITNELESYIETGEFKSEKENELEGFSLQQIGKKAGGNSATVKGTSYVKKEGKIAIVGLEVNLPDYNTSVVVDLKMRDRGNYWQLAEISNFGQMITKLNQLEQAKLQNSIDP